MKLTLVIEVSPTDDVNDDVDERQAFIDALKETFEDQFNADPTEVYETAGEEYTYEITEATVIVE